MTKHMNPQIAGWRIGRRMLAVGGAAIAAGFLARPALAQAWPARPIRIVVPSPPGGTSEIYMRYVGTLMSERLGQPVVFDNRPSAGGVIAATTVARAAPDGYTLLTCASSTLAIAPVVQGNTSFDPLHDFAPVSLIYVSPLMFVGTRNFAPKTISELIALAKAQPGKITLAHPGNGTTNHAAAELFNRAAGTDIMLVPYVGNAAVVTALTRGDVDMAIDSIPTSGPLVREGVARVLAVAGTERSPSLPDVPTVAESGLPGYEAIFWNGVFAPAGTPAEIINRLSTEIDRGLRHPALAEQMRAAGAEPVGGPPEVLARRFATDVETWGRVIREARIRNE